MRFTLRSAGKKISCSDAGYKISMQTTDSHSNARSNLKFIFNPHIPERNECNYLESFVNRGISMSSETKLQLRIEVYLIFKMQISTQL